MYICNLLLISLLINQYGVLDSLIQTNKQPEIAHRKGHVVVFVACRYVACIICLGKIPYLTVSKIGYGILSTVFSIDHLA